MHCRYRSVLQAFHGFCCAVTFPLGGVLNGAPASGVIDALDSIVGALFRGRLGLFPSPETATYLAQPSTSRFAFWGQPNYPSAPASVRAVQSVGDYSAPSDFTVSTGFDGSIELPGLGRSYDRSGRRLFLRSYLSLFLPQSDPIHGPIPTNRETSSPGSYSEANSPRKTHSEDGVARAA